MWKLRGEWGVGSGEVHGGARVYGFLFLYVEAGMNEGFFPSNWWSVNLIRTGIAMRDRDKEIDAWESLGVFLSCFLIFFFARTWVYVRWVG